MDPSPGKRHFQLSFSWLCFVGAGLVMTEGTSRRMLWKCKPGQGGEGGMEINCNHCSKGRGGCLPRSVLKDWVLSGLTEASL